MGPSSGHGAVTGLSSPRLLTGAAARQGKGRQASSSPQQHRPPAQRCLPHSPSLGQLRAGAGLGSPPPAGGAGGGRSGGSPHLCRQLLTLGFALQQTAGGAVCGGADTGVSTIPPTRAFLSAPTSPRPQRLVLRKTNRARGLGESCRPRRRRTGSDGDAEVAPRHGKRAVLMLTADPGRLPGDSGKLLRNRSPQRTPANGLRLTPPVPGRTPAGLCTCALSHTANSPS